MLESLFFGHNCLECAHCTKCRTNRGSTCNSSNQYDHINHKCDDGKYHTSSCHTGRLTSLFQLLSGNCTKDHTNDRTDQTDDATTRDRNEAKYKSSNTKNQCSYSHNYPPFK